MAFMNSERIRMYPRIFLLGFLLVLIPGAIYFLIKPESLRNHPDFWVFYTGGLMAQEGNAALAYEHREVQRTFKEMYPNMSKFAGWYYPPVFFFIAETLTMVSYPVSMLLWVLFTGAFFFLAIRPYVKNSDEWWIVVAYPAVFGNVLYGQNAFLTAGLLVIAYRYLFTRQVIAGIAIGLLCIKPHFALLLPVVLFAYRRWTAIFSAVATVTVIVLASVARYGIEPWKVFFTDNMQFVTQMISIGALPIGGMSSIYVQGAYFGLPSHWAMGLQLPFSLGAMLCLVVMVRRQVPYRLVMAFLLAATLPSAPHNFHYDWVILVLPMLLLWREIETTELYRIEKIIMIATFVTPLILTKWIPWGVFVLLALLYVIARRAFKGVEI